MNPTPPDHGWQDHAALMADRTVRPESRWHGPLATTPRHRFVPRWWAGDDHDGEWVYRLHDGPGDPGAWMNTAYDPSLSVVTRVGPHHADHAAPGATVAETWPTSSATLPKLVVQMYREAFTVVQMYREAFIADDSRLLVTCGSGYGTALACARLGDRQVTSIDIDGHLVEAARERLAQAGHRPEMEVCDLTGALPGDYDRIISTVAVPGIPASWLKALTPGGRLVTTLSGTGLVIVADKTPDGGARGQVAPETAMFMNTRHGDDCPPPHPHTTSLWATARTAEGDVTTGRYPVMRVTGAWDVRSTLHLIAPGIEHAMDTADNGARTAYMIHEDGSWARARASGKGELPIVHQGGPRRLWDLLDKIRTWLVTDGDLPVVRAAVRIAHVERQQMTNRHPQYPRRRRHPQGGRRRPRPRPPPGTGPPDRPSVSAA
ncbi:methyltransferase domain-containing protein [Streptomyces sp. NPDC006798]|uniref:methyltransferase domain-containing protein n=1 Tax=Streptomyces sp. NPDC006798 TaxID=3155462 RepID=UPI0033F85CE7